MSGGSSSPSSTTQTQKLDPFMKSQIKNNIGAINEFGEAGYQPLKGPAQAAMTPEQQAQLQSQFQLGQQGQGLIGQGTAGLGGVANTQAQQVGAGTADLAPFQNQFTDQVVNSTLQDIDRSRQMAVNQGQDAALASGAFAGSRSALVDAETNRNYADRAASAAGQLRSQGFNTALQAAQNQQGMGLQAQLANQSSGLDAARLRLLGSQGLLGAGQSLYGLGQGASQYMQDRAQAHQDFKLSQRQAAQRFPQEVIAMRSAALGNMPFAGTTSTTGGGGSNRFGSALGGAASGAAMGGMLAGASSGAIGGVPGMAIGGGIGLLGGLFG